MTRRTLAHEFGHLLGFSDAYLRSYRGDPRDPYGVVLVEWTGLIDNLMGSPEVGRVTEGMIETLIDAYGERQAGWLQDRRLLEGKTARLICQ